MIYRAYFAIPGHLSTKSGLHTNAIFGFTTMFRKLLAGRTPELVGVVFDAPGPTFRDEVYAEYKAGRSRMPEDLREQLPWIDRVVAAHNFPLIRHPGVEADDVIGTLAVRGVAAGMDVVIVSADKDFTQLIGPQVRLFDAIRDITYDEALAVKKWGVPPAQFIDLLALLGDKLDNIPGVPGIGTKSAIDLLSRYGSFSGILAHLDELTGRQRKALEEGRESGLLSRTLATIDTDVAIEVELEDLRFTPPDQEALNALFLELEFFSLLGMAAKRKQETEEAEVHHRVGNASELAAFEGDPLSVAYLGVGFAVAPPSGQALYVPFRPEEREALARFFGDPARRKIAHDAKGLIEVLAGLGIPLAGLAGDTQLASFLIDPTKIIPHRLDQIAKEYLQRILRPLQDLTGRGKKARRPSELAPEEVAEWLAHQAQTIALAWPILEARVRETGQSEQLSTRDLPLSRVLAEMELAGILVDRAELEKLETEFQARLATFEAEIWALAGRSFNLGSPRQLAEILFGVLGLPVIKRTKTGYSTNAEVLERLAPKHPIAHLLIEHRKLAKLINTYTSVLAAAIDPNSGRVHANFQMTASATGRLISTDPDLQRTPIKTEDGARVRRAFVAPPGCALISADWSQIELRVLAHFSDDPFLVDSFQKNIDVHRRTAAQLFQVAEAEVTPEQRNVAKTVNFATIYGQGALALSQILGIERREAEAYIQGYFSLHAGVRRWLDRTVEEARREGWVETLLGRRRFIPELFSKNPMDGGAGERIAVNTPIQGSAADIARLAMIRVRDALTAEGMKARLLLQIHDELVLEAPESEVERACVLVRHHMEHAVSLRVPLVVQVGSGRTWKDAH